VPEEDILVGVVLVVLKYDAVTARCYYCYFGVKKRGFFSNLEECDRHE
jgi:hypothetical protein